MGSYKQAFGLTTCVLLFAALSGCGGGGEPEYVASNSTSTDLVALSSPGQPPSSSTPAAGEEPKPEPKPGSGPSPAPTSEEPKPAPPPEEPKPAPPPVASNPPPPPPSPPDETPPPAAPDPLPAEEDQPVSAQVLATVARVKLRPSSLSFDVAGATYQLNAYALDANDDPVPGVAFTWSTSNSASVTVTRSGGLLTARKNGDAIITATVRRSSLAATTEVSVKLPETLVLTPESWPSAEVWIGARRQFVAQVVNGRGSELPGYDMTWTSSNTNVLRVDDTGLVTVHGRGTARLEVTTGSMSEGVDVIVNGEGSNVPGYMYTTWAGRTDNSPALLVDGALKTSEMYHFEEGYPHGNLRYAEILPPWSRNTVEKFQYAGNRVGLLTDVANGAGTLRILDRAAEWAILSIGSAQDFALEGNRIAMLHADGRLLVRDGTHDAWTEVASGGIAYFQLERDFIGLLREDGTAYVKEGIDGAWHLLDAAGVTDLQLEGDRIAVLTAAGEFKVKDGLGAAFTTLAASGATRFRMAAERIAVEANGVLRVKVGIHGGWTVLSSEPVRQFELAGDHIGILDHDGMLRVQNVISGLWRTLDTEGVREIQLQENLIGRLTTENRLVVRVGLYGTELRSEAYAGSITQFRVIVDNPVAPHRTTPASYDAGQARCRELDAEDGDPWFGSQDCYPEYLNVPIASFYGVYCGDDRPNTSLTIARDAFESSSSDHAVTGMGGPIDGMDFLCNHHDAVGSWYPEIFGGPFDGDIGGACVVRYGLRRGRLTLNGNVIATGQSNWDTWDAAWGSEMPHLKGALDRYWTHTNSCSDSNLQDFDEMTGAEH